MEGIFQKGPNDVSDEEANHGFDKGLYWDLCKASERKSRLHGEKGKGPSELKKRPEVEICCNREPDNWHYVPSCSCLVLYRDEDGSCWL